MTRLAVAVAPTAAPLWFGCPLCSWEAEAPALLVRTVELERIDGGYRETGPATEEVRWRFGQADAAMGEHLRLEHRGNL